MHRRAKLGGDTHARANIIANGDGGQQFAPGDLPSRRTGKGCRHRMHAGMSLAELVALIHFQRCSGGAVQQSRHAGRPRLRGSDDQGRAVTCLSSGQLCHVGLGGAADNGTDAIGKDQRRSFDDSSRQVGDLCGCREIRHPVQSVHVFTCHTTKPVPQRPIQ